MSDFNTVLNLLLPHCDTPDKRYSLIQSAFSDQPRLLAKINYAGSALEFVPRLIRVLQVYGKTPSGEQALWKLLLTLRNQGGPKLEKAVDDLEAWANAPRDDVVLLPGDEAPHMVPRLPEEYVQRKQLHQAIVASLINDERTAPRHAIGVQVVTLLGEGGFGKTTLAEAVGWDDAVRGAFKGGILFVTIGESAAQLTDKWTAMFQALKGTDETPSDPLSQLIKAMPADVLIILDDVWDRGHIEGILHIARCTYLITTRESSVAVLAKTLSARHTVAEMTPEEARDVLIQYVPQEIRPRITTKTQEALKVFAEQLGEWPLLLDIHGWVIREECMNGSRVEEALAFVQEGLRKVGLDPFPRGQDDATRRRTLQGSMSASLRRYSDTEKQRLYELAIFPEDTAIPEVAVFKLWYATSKMDSYDAKILLRRLAGHFCRFRSENEGEALVVRFHNKIREHLARQLRDKPLLHEAFLVVYGVAHWSELSQDEPYLWRWLAYHLREAEQIETLRGLLLNFRFLQAKLNATDVNALLVDFEDLTDDKSLRLVESALSMSVHILSEDKTQLSSQLYGRLMSHSDKKPALISLLELVSTQAHLQSLHPTLNQAGGALIRTIPLEYSGNALALTDDGKHLLVATGTQAKVFVWHTGKLLTTFIEHTLWIGSVSIQGELAFTASNDGTVKVWRWATGEIITDFKIHLDMVTGVSVQGELAFTASNDGTVKVWRWATGEVLMDYKSSVDTLAISGDLVFSTSGRMVKVWRWATGEVLSTFAEYTNSVTALSVQGDVAFTASNDRTVKVWRWATGELLSTFSEHTNRVIAISVQGDVAFTASIDKTVKVWWWATGEVLTTFTGHISNVLAVNTRGELAFSASIDKTVKIWRWRTSEAFVSLSQHTGTVTGVSIQGNLAFSTSGQMVKVWQWATGEVMATFTEHAAWVTALSVQGDLAFTGSDDKTVKVWRWATGEVLTTFTEHTSSVTAINVQGDLAFTASNDGTVEVWRWATGEMLTTFTEHASSVAAISVQGDLIFTGSDDRTVKVWRWATGEILTTFTEHTDWVRGVSVQGGLALSCDSDVFNSKGTAKVWRWTTGEVLMNFTQHKNLVNSVVILGRLALSASEDGTVKVWHWATGEIIATFTSDAPLQCLAFEPQQRILLAGDNGGRVHVLRLVGLDHLLFPDGQS